MMLEAAKKNPIAFLNAFLRKSGITEPIREQQFISQFRKRFGKPGEAFLECVSRRGDGESLNIYPLKNVSIDFANAVLSQWDAKKLTEVARWIIEGDLSPTTILEVGCDNGWLACLLGLLFPEAKVVGIDPNPEGIALARQRVVALGLTNVDFQCTSLETSIGTFQTGSFDLILAVAVFHEALASELVGIQRGLADYDYPIFGLADFDRALQPLVGSNAVIEGIAQLLSPSGQFVSVDRWGFDNKLLTWVRLCGANGLHFRPLPSRMIHVKRAPGEDQESFPLSVFRSVPLAEGQLSAEEILVWMGSEKFGSMPIPEPSAAEAIFASLSCPKVALQFKATYLDGSGIQLIYLGTNGALGFSYTTTSTGFRDLNLMPIFRLQEAIEVALPQIEALLTVAKVTANWDPMMASLRRVGAPTERILAWLEQRFPKNGDE